MTVNTVPGGDRRDSATDFPQRYARDARLEALYKLDVAEMSATSINFMTCDELVRIIRVAGLPVKLSHNLDNHLPFYDHTALTPLAHLAQRCCRNQRQGSLIKDAE